MGPRRGKSAKRPGKKPGSQSEPKLTIEQLLVKTQALMDDNSYELALKTAVQAVALDESNTQALLLAAIIQLESGDIEPAMNCLLRCVELSPDRGFEKYMYLGQFTVERESARYFQLGVDAIQRDLDEAPKDSDYARVLRRKMAEAYVSMTEIYLTDCCFESDAELKCEEYLRLAAAADPGCPEVLQTMASVRLSQSRTDDARECVSRSMAMWAACDQNDPAQIPSYENRLALVRLLLELDDKERALSIMERLQREDDENVDLWYLYGWTYYLQGEEAGAGSADRPEDADAGSADRAEVLASARECFKQAIKLAAMQEFENDALVDHARELLAAIGSVRPLADGQDDGDDDDDNTLAADAQEQDWEDVSSSDDDDDVEMAA